MEFEYEDLRFEEDKKKNKVEITFLNLFGFELDLDKLKKIGYTRCKSNKICFEINPGKKWRFLLEDGFKELRNKLNNKKTIYIHQGSGIPLIGHVAFGIIDRNTNLIEIKPITTCNLDCIYCSVDAGKRPIEFVVEKDYLIKELRKLIRFKECQDVEIHIGAQGEPLMYKDLALLIKDAAAIPEVKRISIDTNGTLLTKRKVDELLEAGLTRFNVSINAFEAETAKKIANAPYNIEQIKRICKYTASKGKNLLLAPVWIPGMNDKEIEKIVEFGKKLDVLIGIQNFLNYKYGKNPVKEIEMEEFYNKLEKLEEKYDWKLIHSAEDFGIMKTKKLLCPFKKNEIIRAKIICDGRLKGEKITSAKNRVISLPNYYDTGKKEHEIIITKIKHNIILGEKK